MENPINKPLHLWVLKDAKEDYLTWEPTRHTAEDFFHMVDHSAYKKAVDALKKIEDYFCACSIDDEIIPQVVAREALKELGEM